MRKISIKKALLTLICAVVLLVSVSMVYAQENIKLFVNGKEIITDVPLQNINGRIMVPARFVAEALGAGVQWDDANKRVIVSSEEKYKFLKLDGNQTAWLYWEEDGKVYVEINNLKEIFRTKYPQKLISLAFSSNTLVVENRNIDLRIKTFGNFKAISLDYIYVMTGMLDFEFDSATGNLKLK